MTNRICLTAMLAVCAGANAATTYNFASITNTSATNSSAGAAQLTMTATAVGTTQVDFLFRNTGSTAMSVANIYFDDAATPILMACASITNGAGVSFSAGGSPSNLPSGANVSFVSAFRFRAANPAPSNGVNPGEQVTLRFNLAAGMDFDDVTGALDSQAMRVGMHVIAFANGGSESFVNQPPPEDPPVTSVPLPTGAGLGFAGLFGLAARRSRR